MPPSLLVRLLAVLALLALWAVSAQAQPSAHATAWEPTAGPEGGQASRVLTTPGDSSTVYAVVQGSLYRSEDGGHAWREPPDDLPGTRDVLLRKGSTPTSSPRGRRPE